MCPQAWKSAAVHICEMYAKTLVQPLENTSKPPHVLMVADKGTFNRKTNQAVKIGIIQKGKRLPS